MKRSDLKGLKNITIIGRVKSVDWDGWNNKPTYLLDKIQVFDKDSKSLGHLDHLWFHTDEPLDELENRTLIKFSGDAYHYTKKDGEGYGVHITNTIRVLRKYLDKVTYGKWYKVKSPKWAIKDNNGKD